MVIVVFSLLALSLDHSSVVECQMETQNSWFPYVNHGILYFNFFVQNSYLFDWRCMHSKYSSISSTCKLAKFSIHENIYTKLYALPSECNITGRQCSLSVFEWRKFLEEEILLCGITELSSTGPCSLEPLPEGIEWGFLPSWLTSPRCHYCFGNLFLRIWFRGLFYFT
jgi:hypothetical protein